MTDTPPAAPRSATRIALIVSLGLNLVILGSLGGLALKHELGPPPPPVRNLAFGPFTEALSPEDRAALLHAFGEQAKGFRAERAQMREDLQTVLAALRATPYDPQVFADVMVRQKARTDQWLGLGQKLLMERIAAMSPAERSAFADRLQDSMERHARRDAARDKAPPPDAPDAPAAAPGN